MADLKKVPFENIQAVIPFYCDGTGSITKVITRDGLEINLCVTVKTVLNRIAKYYLADLISMREKYGRFINQKTMIPLPFSQDLILIPFKMRIPRIPADGAIGYVSLSAIKSIDCLMDKCCIEIITCTNYHIRCIVSYGTACKNINNARLIKNDYITINKAIPLSAQASFIDYSKPATLADLIFWANHIGQLIISKHDNSADGLRPTTTSKLNAL